MKTIIVLGMHRSGTSAISKAIAKLGAAAGPKRHLGVHWENVPMRRLNERLLTLGGGTWDAPPPREWLERPDVRTLVGEARELVTEQFDDAPIAVWKDPRACLTMPFWKEVFDEAVYLLIFRHPSEVAASLTERNAFGPGQGYAIWERYNADALRAVAGTPTVVLEYADVVGDPVESLELTTKGFANVGVTLPNDPATTDHGLVAQKRHHEAETGDDLAEIATPSQRETFDMLRSLVGAHQALELPAPVPEPMQLSTELLAVAASLRETKRQHREQRNQRSTQAATGDSAKRSGKRKRRGNRRSQAGSTDSTDSPA